MAKVGRPTKFNDVMYQKLKELIQMDCSDTKIAEVLGVKQPTIALWKKKNPEFMMTYKIEKEKQTKAVQNSMLKIALGYEKTVNGEERYYPPYFAAQRFILTNRRPDDWKDTPELLVDAKQTFTVNFNISRPQHQVFDVGKTDVKVIQEASGNGNGNGQYLPAARRLDDDRDS